MIFRVSARHTGRRGFTLVELLTVIAIIAILAALLFPVMAKARDQARQGGCMSNMHSIIQGLKMYRDDWRVYPDALYGIQYDPGQGYPVTYQNRLYPSYVKDRKTFNCPNSPVKVPPESSPGSGSVWVPPLVRPLNRTPGAPALGYQVAQFSSYDCQYRNDANLNNTSGVLELHYVPHWTAVAAGTQPPAAALTEYARQLCWREPPDSTVVTWCLYHSGMDNSGNPAQNGLAVVGFLSGRVQTLPATSVANWTGASGTWPWQVSPKD